MIAHTQSRAPRPRSSVRRVGGALRLTPSHRRDVGSARQHTRVGTAHHPRRAAEPPLWNIPAGLDVADCGSRRSHRTLTRGSAGLVGARQTVKTPPVTASEGDRPRHDSSRPASGVVIPGEPAPSRDLRRRIPAQSSPTAVWTDSCGQPLVSRVLGAVAPVTSPSEANRRRLATSSRFRTRRTSILAVHPRFVRGSSRSPQRQSVPYAADVELRGSA